MPLVGGIERVSRPAGFRLEKYEAKHNNVEPAFNRGQKIPGILKMDSVIQNFSKGYIKNMDNAGMNKLVVMLTLLLIIIILYPAFLKIWKEIKRIYEENRGIKIK